MKEYGLDGVFMQRFVGEIRGESGLKHFNTVLNSAMKAANKYERAICVMYDLSGMRPGDEDVLLKDIADVAKRHSLNPSMCSAAWAASPYCCRLSLMMITGTKVYPYMIRIFIFSFIISTSSTKRAPICAR